MTLRYLSVCSGIEAASQAWLPLGWTPLGFYETDPFCAALLKLRYPSVPNGGDFTKADWSRLEDVDVLAAGTPCQDFSMAGRRAGTAGAKGSLTLALGRKIDELKKLKVFIWENVPGVLSDRGNAFGSYLALLAGEVQPFLPPGGRWTDAGFVLGPQRAIAWRCLDAQYFGLAQRRKRVFIVACPRKGADPRQILFESEGRRRDIAPSRQTGKKSAAAFGRRPGGHSETAGEVAGENAAFQSLNRPPFYASDLCPTLSGGPPFARPGQSRVEGQAFVALAFGAGQTSGPLEVLPTLNGGGAKRLDFETEAFIAHTLRGEGFDGSEDGTGRATLVVFAQNQNGNLCLEDKARTLTNISNSRAGARNTVLLASRPGVRRLTPRECERLQGFPDDYTRIPWRGRQPEDCPDGRRYQAIGNAMAVPVMRWLGERLAGELEPGLGLKEAA